MMTNKAASASFNAMGANAKHVHKRAEQNATVNQKPSNTLENGDHICVVGLTPQFQLITRDFVVVTPDL